jgi:hypothetical protein
MPAKPASLAVGHIGVSGRFKESRDFKGNALKPLEAVH